MISIEEAGMVLEELKNDVILYPSEILRKKCKSVGNPGDITLKNIITSMFETMKKYHGIGLAAPQIGLEQRYFVCNVTGKEEDDLVFVNPEIQPVGKMVEMVEGCLSFPAVEVLCKRAKKCEVKAFDIEGKEFELGAEGLLARVIQHEYEHLEGRLIVDRMTETDKIANKRSLESLKAMHKAAETEKVK